MRTIDLVSIGQGSTGCAGQSGCSSGVEHHVANVIVVGSNPITRSIFSHHFAIPAKFSRSRRKLAETGASVRLHALTQLRGATIISDRGIVPCPGLRAERTQ